MRFIFLIAIASSILLADFDSFMIEMKKKESFYQDSNNSARTKKELISTYNIPSEEKILADNAELLSELETASDNAISDHLPWVTEKMFSGEFGQEVNEAIEIIKQSSIDNKEVNTIFYLFSMSQSEYTLFNFVDSAAKIEKRDKDLRFYGVVQGILSKDDLNKLYKPFKNHSELSAKAIIKMHPFIYKDLNVDRVPAYLFSKCKKGEFKYKDCKNEYLVRGDISLHAALEIVTREDKTYQKYLDAIEGRE